MKTQHIHFHHYHEGNPPPHLPFNTNKLAYSSFKRIEDTGQVGGIGIKYVIQGTENYTVGHEMFGVTDKHFLLLNQHTPFHVFIDSQENTTGLCINLSTEMVKDVLQNFEKEEEKLLDLPFDFRENSSKNVSIVDKIYPANEESPLGKELQNLANIIENQIIAGNSDNFLLTTDDIYYNLTVALLESQSKVFNQMNKLKSVKPSTRKELFKRLSVAKEYIDENLQKNIDIQDISRVATISPFHFHRTFKTVYGLSPHQYRIQKRLGKAAELLMDIEHSVTEIAFLTGFNDIHSFSRSFKKEYGVPPTKYRKNGDGLTV